jgi:hypothetical protein
VNERDWRLVTDLGRLTGAVAKVDAAAGRELADRLTSLLGDQPEARRRAATRELGARLVVLGLEFLCRAGDWSGLAVVAGTDVLHRPAEVAVEVVEGRVWLGCLPPRALLLTAPAARELAAVLCAVAALSEA